MKRKNKEERTFSTPIGTRLEIPDMERVKKLVWRKGLFQKIEVEFFKKKTKTDVKALEKEGDKK